MNDRPLLELTDTPLSAIVKISQGNPGASTACVEMFKVDAAVDPDTAIPGIGVLLALDTHGIYGPKVWMLFKDCCDQVPTRAIAALRAVQLGIMPEGELLAAIDRGVKLHFVEMVQKKLPAFAPEWVSDLK